MIKKKLFNFKNSKKKLKILTIRKINKYMKINDHDIFDLKNESKLSLENQSFLKNTPEKNELTMKEKIIQSIFYEENNYFNNKKNWEILLKMIFLFFFLILNLIVFSKEIPQKYFFTILSIIFIIISFWHLKDLKFVNFFENIIFFFMIFFYLENSKNFIFFIIPFFGYFMIKMKEDYDNNKDDCFSYLKFLLITFFYLKNLQVHHLKFEEYIVYLLLFVIFTCISRFSIFYFFISFLKILKIFSWSYHKKKMIFYYLLSNDKKQSVLKNLQNNIINGFMSFLLIILGINFKFENNCKYLVYFFFFIGFMLNIILFLLFFLLSFSKYFIVKNNQIMETFFENPYSLDNQLKIEELKNLKCNFCKENNVNIFFQCGHWISCEECWIIKLDQNFECDKCKKISLYSTEFIIENKLIKIMEIICPNKEIVTEINIDLNE